MSGRCRGSGKIFAKLSVLSIGIFPEKSYLETGKKFGALGIHTLHLDHRSLGRHHIRMNNRWE
jgi:hypothetical protein